MNNKYINTSLIFLSTDSEYFAILLLYKIFNIGIYLYTVIKILIIYLFFCIFPFNIVNIYNFSNISLILIIFDMIKFNFFTHNHDFF